MREQSKNPSKKKDEEIGDEFQMMIINAKEMLKIADENEMINGIEEAFHLFAKGDFVMPERITVRNKEDNMLYMPCLTDEAIGTKILAQFPDNPSKGKPLIDGVMLLNDGEDGSPKALMNGRVLTGIRTGAVGGHAIKHLSRPGSKSLGIVGCGVQGFYQAKYACAVRNIKEIHLLDYRNKDLSDFIRRLKEEIKDESIQYTVAKNSTELVKNSEIIVTATSSKTPVLPDDARLLKGKCIVAIGSWRPDMREIPDAIWDVADAVYTELPFACEESGDLLQPLESGRIDLSRVRFMADFLIQKEQGEDRELGETRYYKSVGMSLFDLVIAGKLYESALKKGLGTTIEW